MKKELKRELKKCRINSIYFAENYCYVKNDDNTLSKLQLRRIQKMMLKKMEEELGKAKF